MKTLKTNGAKRAMSFVLAFAMLLGSLFIANVGININADAETDSTLKISYWTGGQTAPTKTESDGTYLITTADELCYVVYNVGGIADYGAKFKIDSSVVDVIILQKEEDIKAAGGAEALMSLSSAAEVKDFFENKMTSKTDWFSKFAWKCYDATLFDGSGVPIYGLYSIGDTQAAGNQNVGLFPSADTGEGGTDSSTPNTDSTGVTYKNIIIKNSYMKSARRLGAIVAATSGSAYGKYVNGVSNFENCVVANNYMVCEAGNAKYTVTASGILLGSCDTGDWVSIKNCLVYGNDATHISYEDATTTNIPLANTNVASATVTDTISLGVSPSSTMGSNATYTNVYTDQTASYDGITNIGSADMVKGAFGKVRMPDLDWATDSTDGDWYAVANDYPTPIKPDGWTDIEELDIWDGTTADAFAGGSGTKADPYIIENASQLNKMVYDGGRTSDGTTENYYKVADGVDALYLNAAISNSMIQALVGTGTYNKWSFDETVFNGKFDGNGVIIYGMVSNESNVGFVPYLGYNAVIENVIFSAAYVTGNRAAVIATNVNKYTDNNDDNGEVWENSYITNVSVINSYIKSTSSSTSGATAAGFISATDTPDLVYLTNCVFDGGTCTLLDAAADRDKSAVAGMVSFPSWGNNYLFENCVSIDAYIVPMVTSVAQNTTDGTWYQRYPLARTSKVEFTNCYSDINPVMYNTVTVSGTDYVYDRITNGVSEIEVTTEGVYDQKVMPTLDWKNTWSLVEVTSGRFIPMPIKDGIEGDYANYNEILKDQQDGRGANMGTPYANGTYGMLHEFVGSGTETDPYMIYTALDLARAIGCGGVNLNQTLHFKLANDIDLENLPWITQATDSQYTYVAFKGTLDGNGYTVTGLNAGDKNSAGLIPVLAGGTVKNLHVRDSYVGSTSYAGALVGDAQSGTISGCSVEDSVVVSKSADWHIFGSVEATISDLYYIAGEGSTATYDNVYVDESSNLYTDETDEFITYSTSSLITKIKEDANTATWYIGGTDDSTPKLVNRAQTMVYTDIAGDDNGSEYDSNDLIALRRKLLKKSAYANIYGDVTRDGDINIVDLAVLCRQIGGDYGQIEDGFWAAVANNKMAIYYSENDTMDMARTLELYLEAAVNGLDIEKYATSDAVTDPTAVIGTPDGVFDIVLVDSNDSTNYDDYSIEYDEDSAVLTITGGSFTAVEQAVLAFAANSNYATDEICIGSGSIVTDTDTTYAARTINGTTYYYAWGDEFNTGTSYSQDTWEINDYKSETDGSQSGRYWNKETVGVDDINQLWEITDDGQLKIWRGLDSSVYDETAHSWGYKSVTVDPDGNGKTDYNKAVDSGDVYVDPGCINTQKSMLFKQGYIEMKATLPSDGHAFPAWWFLTGPSLKYNNYFDATLYNKVYIKNPNWTGVNAMVASDLSTYKYQIPAAHLEYDIVEVMQSPQDDTLAKNYLTAASDYSNPNSAYKGTYISYTNLTVHKIYNENVYDGNLYIPNWSKGTSTNIGDIDTFVTTTTDQFIHNYNTSKYTNEYDFGNINKMQGEHIFGFAWTVDESEGTYTLTVYVDGESKMTVNQDVGHAATDDPTYVNGDADIWNQYAYMLLDNSFYSSNPYYADNPSANFTDLLTKESKAYGRDSSWNTLSVADKATFEVDYVRVYQQNDMRDIVTDETEAFNNGNRFGYGK